MSIPRFSPIDDDVQVWNEDEYEAGYQARQEDVPSPFQLSGVGVLAGPTPIWIIFMLEAASSDAWHPWERRGFPTPQRSLARWVYALEVTLLHGFVIADIYKLRAIPFPPLWPPGKSASDPCPRGE